MNRKLLKLSLVFATPIAVAPISASCKFWDDFKNIDKNYPKVPNSTPITPETKDEGETDTNAFFSNILTGIPKWEVSENAFYGPHGFFHYGNNLEKIKTSNDSYISKDEYKSRVKALEEDIQEYSNQIRWHDFKIKPKDGSPKNPIELAGKTISQEYEDLRKKIYTDNTAMWETFYGIKPDRDFLLRWKTKFQFFGESDKSDPDLIKYLKKEDNKKCFDISNQNLLLMFYPLWNMYYQFNTASVTVLTRLIVNAKKTLFEKIQDSSKTLEEQLKDSEIIDQIEQIVRSLSGQFPSYKALEYQGKLYAFPLSNNKELYNHAWYYKQLIAIWNEMWAPLAYLSGAIISGNDYFFDRPNEINETTNGESATKGQTAKYMFNRTEYGSSAKGCYIPKLIHHSYSTAISTLKNQKDYLTDILGLKFKSIA
ncbi:hypothetical protein PR256_01555 [Metamycoplasma hyosynoviae]|uniref:hypothetical protein n=1 Tax=Metamycoplasma hyosynoviae TaxID=29559 RepID=UPI0023597104|nr:hypothetical protein [Metamycoplasma hyosynoviae]MDC8917024.1 hypothetical protein [Metamycoplasma hyosynoviae]